MLALSRKSDDTTFDVVKEREQVNIFEREQQAMRERREQLKREYISTLAAIYVSEQRAASIIASEQAQYMRDVERAAIVSATRIA